MDLLSTELKFAQQLASNEKKVRDKSLKKLKSYLQAKSASKTKGFTHEDLLRIWKGLHYCMWMQDKPLIQEELSTKISQLVHELSKAESKLLFIKVFIQTEAREWDGIDVWRVDKFMMLFRSMLTESLMVLKNQSWKVKIVEGLMAVYSETLLNPDEDLVPFGLRTHFIDIYLDEVHKVGSNKINGKQFLQLIEPFIRFLLVVHNQDLSNKVVNKIFDPIIERTRRLNSRRGKNKGKIPDGDVMFPDLQIDSKMLADHIFDLGQQESTPKRKRELFYSIVKRLQNACDGVSPPVREEPTDQAIPKQMVDEAVSSLVKLELKLNQKPTKKQLKAEKKKKKNLLKINGKENSAVETLDIPVSTSSNEVPVSSGKKRKHSEAMEDKPSKQFEKKAKKELYAKHSKDESVGTKKRKTDGQEKMERSGKGQENKLNSSVQETNLTQQDRIQLDSNEEDKTVAAQINGSGIGAAIMEKESLENLDKSENTEDKGKVKSAKKHESIETNSDIPCSTKSNENQDSDLMESNVGKISKESETITDKCVNTLNEDKPSEALDKVEPDIPTPSKKYKGKINMSPGKFAAFETKKTPTAFVKRALSKTNKKVFGTPALVKRKRDTPTTSGPSTGKARRVSFNMKNNQSQSFKDSLKSPIVPFNPLKMPDQSILKSTPGSMKSTPGSLKLTPGSSMGRRSSADTPPSSGSLKTLKTPKRTLSHRAAHIRTPKMSLQAKLKRKVASDFFL